MSKKQQKAVNATTTAVQTNRKRTPEELRATLREHGIETASGQMKSIAAIYSVGTHEEQVNLRTLLSAIGKVQNLISLQLRATAIKGRKDELGNGFFLTA